MLSGAAQTGGPGRPVAGAAATLLSSQHPHAFLSIASAWLPAHQGCSGPRSFRKALAKPSETTPAAPPALTHSVAPAAPSPWSSSALSGRSLG